ncbi:MAG: hypothetical protein P8L31_07470, partial [Pseudomonadales bacterium]|nr:hypothetical protein [Pseudomonadales bacterium]
MKLFSWEAFKGLVSRTVASRAAEQDGASASLGLVKEHIDGDYYLSKYPDVRVAVIDPAEHYFHWGWREGRNPTPDFKTNAYLLDHPEVAQMG